MSLMSRQKKDVGISCLFPGFDLRLRSSSHPEQVKSGWMRITYGGTGALSRAVHVMAPKLIVLLSLSSYVGIVELSNFLKILQSLYRTRL